MVLSYLMKSVSFKVKFLGLTLQLDKTSLSILLPFRSYTLSTNYLGTYRIFLISTSITD